AKGFCLAQPRCSPVVTPSNLQYLLKYSILSLEDFDSFPHSNAPLMMLVVTPNPGCLLASSSAFGGFHFPVITAWHDGFGDCGVIQNHIAVLNEITGSVDTSSGRLRRSSCIAFPAWP
ncbi:hypothetical protein MUK42_02691, partial [Musa troglodytarum]